MYVEPQEVECGSPKLDAVPIGLAKPDRLGAVEFVTVVGAEAMAAPNDGKSSLVDYGRRGFDRRTAVV